MITPDLVEIITAAIESRLLDVHTCLPGKVISFDSATGKADIELQLTRFLERDDGSFVSEELPVLPDIPVKELRGTAPNGTDFFVHMPIGEGTFGLVHFTEYDPDNWLSSGRLSKPAGVDRHTLGSGFFVPGFYDNSRFISGLPTDACVIGNTTGVSVTIAQDSIEAENNAGDFALSASGQFSANGTNLTVDP